MDGQDVGHWDKANHHLAECETHQYSGSSSYWFHGAPNIDPLLSEEETTPIQASEK